MTYDSLFCVDHVVSGESPHSWLVLPLSEVTTSTVHPLIERTERAYSFIPSGRRRGSPCQILPHADRDLNGGDDSRLVSRQCPPRRLGCPHFRRVRTPAQTPDAIHLSGSGRQRSVRGRDEPEGGRRRPISSRHGATAPRTLVFPHSFSPGSPPLAAPTNVATPAPNHRPRPPARSAACPHGPTHASAPSTRHAVRRPTTLPLIATAPSPRVPPTSSPRPPSHTPRHCRHCRVEPIGSVPTGQ